MKAAPRGVERIFAALADGFRTLSKVRVAELVAAGKGDRFDSRHGRLMKEWIAIPAGHRRQWKRLAEEARGYAGSASKARARRR